MPRNDEHDQFTDIGWRCAEAAWNDPGHFGLWIWRARSDAYTSYMTPHRGFWLALTQEHGKTLSRNAHRAFRWSATKEFSNSSFRNIRIWIRTAWLVPRNVFVVAKFKVFLLRLVKHIKIENWRMKMENVKLKYYSRLYGNPVYIPITKWFSEFLGRSLLEI